jgi:hypothetical protein
MEKAIGGRFACACPRHPKTAEDEGRRGGLGLFAPGLDSVAGAENRRTEHLRDAYYHCLGLMPP